MFYLMLLAIFSSNLLLADSHEATDKRQVVSRLQTKEDFEKAVSFLEWRSKQFSDQIHPYERIKSARSLIDPSTVYQVDVNCSLGDEVTNTYKNFKATLQITAQSRLPNRDRNLVDGKWDMEVFTKAKPETSLTKGLSCEESTKSENQKAIGYPRDAAHVYEYTSGFLSEGPVRERKCVEFMEIHPLGNGDFGYEYVTYLVEYDRNTNVNNVEGTIVKGTKRRLVCM